MGWLKKYAEGDTIQPNGWMDKYGDTLPKAQKGKSFEDITGVKPIRSITQQSEKQPVDKAISKLKDYKNTTSFNQGKETPLYQQKINQNKKEAYAIDHGYGMNNGEIEMPLPLSPGQKRFNKGLEHIATGLEVAGYLAGAGELYSGAKSLLKNKLKQKATQEIVSTSSGMDAVYAKQPGYNFHLSNKQGYVPPTTDPKLMATQGRIDWNGVNYDNIKNWFKTRPTKTINASNSNGVFNTGKPNSVVSNVSGNVSNTGIEIPNSLKNIEQGIINKSKSVSSIDNVENSYPSYNTDIDYSEVLKPKKSLISKLVGTAMSPAVLANNEFTRQLMDAIRKAEPEDVNTKNIRDNLLKIFPGFKEKTLISPKEQGGTIKNNWLNKY